MKVQQARLLAAASGVWIGAYLRLQITTGVSFSVLLLGGIAAAIGTWFYRPRHVFPASTALGVAVGLLGILVGISLVTTCLGREAADPMNSCNHGRLIGTVTKVGESGAGRFRAHIAASRWCADVCTQSAVIVMAFGSMKDGHKPPTLGDKVQAAAKCVRHNSGFHSARPNNVGILDGVELYDVAFSDTNLPDYVVLSEINVTEVTTPAETIADRIKLAGASHWRLLSAIVTGQSAPKTLKAAGLSHLTAVSGLHLSVLIGMALIVTCWAPRPLQIAAVVFVICAVLYVTGWRESVVRAAIMAIIAVGGALLGRRTLPLEALGLAIIFIIARDVRAAASLGLALSVAATLAIIVIAPWASQWFQKFLPLPLAHALSVPLVTQIICAPIVAAGSGLISVAAIPANILAVPAAGPLLACAVIAAVLPESRLGTFAAIGADLFCAWIEFVAAQAATIGQIPWPKGWCGAISLWLFFILVAFTVVGRSSRDAGLQNDTSMWHS